jgi:Protein of unknown function (DUF3995)
MVRALGILTTIILAALALLHIYWAGGGKRGRALAIPTANSGRRLFTPSSIGTGAVAAALLLASFILLGRMGIGATLLPRWVFDWGTWAISLTFLARAFGEFGYVGFFKREHDTDFARWDTWLFSPLCLFIAISAGVIGSN